MRQDIIKENYKNPYYPKKEIRVNKARVLVIIFFILIFYWAYLVFYSPHFKISRIYVNNLEYIDENEVISIASEWMKRRIFFIFAEDRIFWIDKTGLKSEIEKRFLTDEVRISNSGLHALGIFIKEKISCFTWITNDRYYYLDIAGNVKYEVLPEEVNRNYPIIYDGNNKEVILKDAIPVMEEKEITDLIKILEDVGENTNFEIISFKYFNNNVHEAHAKTNEGHEIYFDLTHDIGEQLENLHILSEQGLNNGAKPTSYIDLRFGNRVYSK
ncbi:MAG: hypothetical protein V1770_01210 [bacterium]